MGAGGCSRATGDSVRVVLWPKGASLGGSPVGTIGWSNVLMTVDLEKKPTTLTVSLR